MKKLVGYLHCSKPWEVVHIHNKAKTPWDAAWWGREGRQSIHCSCTAHTKPSWITFTSLIFISGYNAKCQQVIWSFPCLIHAMWKPLISAKSKWSQQLSWRGARSHALQTLTYFSSPTLVAARQKFIKRETNLQPGNPDFHRALNLNFPMWHKSWSTFFCSPVCWWPPSLGTGAQASCGGCSPVGQRSIRHGDLAAEFEGCPWSWWVSLQPLTTVHSPPLL